MRWQIECAQHNTTQHITTQHSTAQHSTAQRSFSPVAALQGAGGSRHDQCEADRRRIRCGGTADCLRDSVSGRY